MDLSPVVYKMKRKTNWKYTHLYIYINNVLQVLTNQLLNIRERRTKNNNSYEHLFSHFRCLFSRRFMYTPIHETISLLFLLVYEGGDKEEENDTHCWYLLLIFSVERRRRRRSNRNHNNHFMHRR